MYDVRHADDDVNKLGLITIANGILNTLSCNGKCVSSLAQRYTNRDEINVKTVKVL